MTKCCIVFNVTWLSTVEITLCFYNTQVIEIIVVCIMNNEDRRSNTRVSVSFETMYLVKITKILLRFSNNK